MNILVTGGSKGIGKLIVDELSKNINNTVYYTYNNTNCQSESNKIAIKVDFNNLEELQRVLKVTDQINFDILINNYHNGYDQLHAHKISGQLCLEGIMINIIPTITLSNHMISSFRKRKKGAIITILTSALNDFPTGCAKYIAEKRYLSAFVEAWQNENLAFGITSVAINPEFISTDMHQHLPDYIRNKNDESSKQRLLQELNRIYNAI
jgi:short-subunit dehydrogenase